MVAPDPVGKLVISDVHTTDAPSCRAEKVTQQLLQLSTWTESLETRPMVI